MADYITSIVTAKGKKQIDYNALANLPGAASTSKNGLMASSDKTKLDAYQPTAIITHNSTTSLPTSAAEGTILIAYDA